MSDAPALYMVWDSTAPRARLSLPPDYDVVAVPSEQVASARAVVELDGTLTAPQWNGFTERILPDGLFVARHRPTAEAIGTASAVHNPRGSRFYFPGGGEIGYLVVAAAHRRRGIGAALVAAAVGRLRDAGYRHIWLGVKEDRLSAIRTYLAAGFVPFLHAPDPDSLEARWTRVYGLLHQPIEGNRWLRTPPAVGEGQ